MILGAERGAALRLEAAAGPLVLLFYGLAGCGKTTLARRAARAVNALYLSPAQFGVAHDADGRPDARRRRERYAAFWVVLESTLSQPCILVLDASFADPSRARLVERIRSDVERTWVAVFCTTSDTAVTLDRIRARRNDPLPWDSRAATAESLTVTRPSVDPSVRRAIGAVSSAAHFTYDSVTCALQCDTPSSPVAHAGAFLRELIAAGPARGGAP